MRVFRHFANLPADIRGSAVAVGNFDGVHLGHREVIAEAGRIARAAGMPWAVLTLEPHPRSVFEPDAPPFRLTPFPVKARLIEALGPEVLVVIPFDPEFARTPPRAFVERVLVRRPGRPARRLRPRLRLRPWPQGDAGAAAVAGRRVRFRLHLRARDQGRGRRAVLLDAHPRLPAARPARRCRPAARPAVRDRGRGGRGRPARPDARLSHRQPARSANTSGRPIGVYAVRARWRDGGG